MLFLEEHDLRKRAYSGASGGPPSARARFDRRSQGAVSGGFEASFGWHAASDEASVTLCAKLLDAVASDAQCAESRRLKSAHFAEAVEKVLVASCCGA